MLIPPHLLAAPVAGDSVDVPGGAFTYLSRHRSREGGFLFFDEGPREVLVRPFQIDAFEVTNAQYAHFLRASGYVPRERRNFLRHWRGAVEPDHPVTWVDLADACAYAAWHGDRLPHDVEWQWAAQGADGRRWPWGDRFDPECCNGDSPGTAPVDAHAGNISPWGVRDLVGNVWEWTADVVTDGWHRWSLLRGGSHYRARGSIWYAEGGAQPVDHHHKLLLMHPAIDRCATVGFRCVRGSASALQLGSRGYA